MKITGTVRSSGSTIEQARLTLLSAGNEIAATLSDDHGRFEMELDHADLQNSDALSLRLDKSGFKSVETIVSAPLDEDPPQYDLELEKEEIEFKLIIKDQKGKPLEGVRILAQIDGDSIGRTITDYTGLATLLIDPELEGRQLFLRAEQRGMEEVSGEIELARDQVLPLTMHRRGWSLPFGILKKSGALLLLLPLLLFLLIFYSLPEDPVEVTVFEMQPPEIMQGETAMLKWATVNAVAVTINGTDVALSGSMEVSPERATEYRLVARNSLGEVEQEIRLPVNLPPEVLQGLVRQFMKIYSELRAHPAGGEQLDVEDPLNALVAAGEGNSLIQEDCRQDALDFAIDTLRHSAGLESTEEARIMAEEHIHHEQEALRGGNFQDLFQHLSECKEFCRPWISQVILCHIQTMAQRKPGIVLFATNSSQVAPRYVEGLLESVAAGLRGDPSRKVLLVGRASKLGPPGYNRKLSTKRATAVRDVLLDKGVPESQIEVLPLGYEPPQMNLEIGRAYGFEELYLAEGDQFMNQSVTVAVF